MAKRKKVWEKERERRVVGISISDPNVNFPHYRPVYEIHKELKDEIVVVHEIGHSVKMAHMSDAERVAFQVALNVVTYLTNCAHDRMQADATVKKNKAYWKAKR